MTDEVNLDNDLGNETQDGFEDDRGGFKPVKKPARPGQKAFIAMIALCSTALAGYALWAGYSGSHTASVEKKPEMFANNLPKYAFGQDDGSNHFEHKTPEATTEKPPGPTPVSPNLPFGAAPNGEFRGEDTEHKKSPEELATERRLTADFSIDNSSSSDTGSDSGSDDDDDDDEKHGPKGNRDSAALEQRLNVHEMAPALAGKMRHQNMTVASGTIIHCGTQEEIDTGLPGGITCRVSQDVWSVNGKVRLIDKGAMVDGQIASAATFGQNRVFVNWVRLRNPDGVIINLDSEGVNDLGSAGYEASVNNHFWGRFGDAILISVFSDLGQTMIQAVTNLAAKSNTTSVSTNETNSSTQQLAQEALQATINIPPSLYKQQGSAVNIYVARDLDFSKVYKLTDK